MFKERFSEETLNRLDNLYFGSNIVLVTMRANMQKQTKQWMSSLVLENLEIVSDDWEDLASESV